MKIENRNPEVLRLIQAQVGKCVALNIRRPKMEVTGFLRYHATDDFFQVENLTGNNVFFAFADVARIYPHHNHPMAIYFD